MTVGTLRDQVIYPHLAEDFRRRGSLDSDLEDILNKVRSTVLYRILYIPCYLVYSRSTTVEYLAPFS